MNARSRRTGYDPEQFVPFVRALMEARNESYREASLEAGLDRSAMWRFLKNETRPHRDACILLAQHFEINPNELLKRAGYDPMPIFDLSLVDPDEYPPEVKALAQTLTAMVDAGRRRRVCDLLQALIAELQG